MPLRGERLDDPSNNPDSLAQGVLGNDERREELDDFVLRASEFNDESLPEALAGNGFCQFGTWHFQTINQAAAADLHVQLWKTGLQIAQQPFQDLAFPLNFFGEFVRTPELQGSGGGNKSEVMPAESTGVFGRFPNVDFTIDQYQRHGQAQSADGFGKDDDVRPNAGWLETKERACATVTDLDIVNDQEDIELPADRFEAA